MLITIRPGLMLHVWRDCVEVARVPMPAPQALGLAHDVIAKIRWPE